MCLTNEELAAIRERAEKATPGDWAYYENDNVVVTLHPDYQYAMEIVEEIGTGFDAEFIAHARADIPKLLAHIEVLEAENKRLKDIIDRIDDLVDEFFYVKTVNGKPTFILKDGLEKYIDIIHEIAAAVIVYDQTR
jgi:hypothetical protein